MFRQIPLPLGQSTQNILDDQIPEFVAHPEAASRLKTLIPQNSKIAESPLLPNSYFIGLNESASTICRSLAVNGISLIPRDESPFEFV